MFLVRTENSHGLSPPSQLSERVRTLRLVSDYAGANSANGGEKQSDADLEEARNALMNKVTGIKSIV
jgi:hypothetical protein